MSYDRSDTYIRIYRKILEWGWHDDPNTFSLFAHLLLSVNIRDKKWKNIVVKRGQIVTSISKLSRLTGLTIKQTRTALEHLKGTNELAIETTPNYSIITVKNFDFYQPKPNDWANEGQTKGKRKANEGQQLDNIDNIDNRDREAAPSLAELESYISENCLNVNAVKFYDYYKNRNWEINGKRIDDWKALVKTWSDKERKSYSGGTYDGVPTLSHEEYLRLKKEAEDNDECD